MAKVLVGMSGGVDSSVAALLLRDAGHEVVGVTMRLATNDSLGIVGESTCCSTADVLDAQAVCDALGIRHVSFDLDEEFAEAVIRPFSDAYAAGLTPNPCIWCNRHLKFGLLWHIAQRMGCEALATGHYARVVRSEVDGCYELRQAADRDKDQSYVLYPIAPDVLPHVLLPLGELSGKEEVRARAAAAGLPTASKHESQDICFVPDGDYPAFLERFRDEELEPGRIVDQAGEVLGEHGGIERFTIGQRKGLAVSVGRRLYVLDKDPITRNVLVGPDDALLSCEFVVAEANWPSGEVVQAPFRGEVVTCYHGFRHACTVEPLGGDAFRIVCDAPVRAIAPGQSAVVYTGDRVVCGGIIQRFAAK